MLFKHCHCQVHEYSYCIELEVLIILPGGEQPKEEVNIQCQSIVTGIIDKLLLV